MRTVREKPARRGERRGVASVLAMLYLVLFSVLAIGFYAASTMNGQIARNQKALELGQAAADGGMQFVRWQLGQMALSGVTQSNLMSSVASALGSQMNSTSNMYCTNQNTGVSNAYSVQVTNVTTGAGTVPTIFIPAPPSENAWIILDSTLGTRFRAMITQTGMNLIITVDGAASNTATGQFVTRAIQMTYNFSQKSGAILNYGVATEGTLATGGSTVIKGQTDPTKGSVLSADMISSTPVVIDGTEVSGDISVVNPSAGVSFQNGTSIGQTTDPAQINASHIHKGVPSPTFPTVDVSVFTNAVTMVPYDGSGTCNNCYITGTQSFTGGMTINGVMWVKAPANIKFAGNTVINGVIVSDQQASSYSATANTLTFAGTVTSTSIANSGYPALAGLTGAFLIAPSFAVTMTGNFGTVNGSIVVGSLTMKGNASGVVQGTVIGMVDTPMSLNGNASITIASTGTSYHPHGLSWGYNYTPLPGSYIEVTPW